jgi:hypothetical protein
MWSDDDTPDSGLANLFEYKTPWETLFLSPQDRRALVDDNNVNPTLMDTILNVLARRPTKDDASNNAVHPDVHDVPDNEDDNEDLGGNEDDNEDDNEDFDWGVEAPSQPIIHQPGLLERSPPKDISQQHSKKKTRPAPTSLWKRRRDPSSSPSTRAAPPSPQAGDNAFTPTPQSPEPTPHPTRRRGTLTHVHRESTTSTTHELRFHADDSAHGDPDPFENNTTGPGSDDDACSSIASGMWSDDNDSRTDTTPQTIPLSSPSSLLQRIMASPRRAVAHMANFLSHPPNPNGPPADNANGVATLYPRGHPEAPNKPPNPEQRPAPRRCYPG